MASVRMVSIESCSMSLAIEHLVELLLPFPRRTICVCPLLPRTEHLAERRDGRLVAEPLEGRDGRSPQRALLDSRGGDRPGERVGQQLAPVTVAQEGQIGRASC